MLTTLKTVLYCVVNFKGAIPNTKIINSKIVAVKPFIIFSLVAVNLTKAPKQPMKIASLIIDDAMPGNRCIDFNIQTNAINTAKRYFNKFNCLHFRNAYNIAGQSK